MEILKIMLKYVAMDHTMLRRQIVKRKYTDENNDITHLNEQKENRNLIQVSENTLKSSSIRRI